jgi:hypothetical protein
MRGFGRNFLMTAFAVLFACCAFAQADSVAQKLKSLGIDSNIIEHSFHTDDGIHYFKVTINAVSPLTNNYTTIEYDPQRDEEKRWEMITFNNDTVTEDWAHDYAKEVNRKRGATIGIYSTKIQSEDTATIVVSFGCDKKNLPDRYKDLSRCTGLAYINKKTKQIDKEEFTDSSAFRLENMDVRTYTMERNFSYDEDEQFNQLISDDVFMDVYVKDKKAKVTVTYIYSDYKKVK